jgi:cephalosporin hydroxylase
MKTYPNNLEVVNGVTFELRPLSRNTANPDWINLRKPRRIVSRYLELASEFNGCNMVEVGIDQGGSTSFFTKLLRPRALLAIDLANQPLPKLMQFLDKHEEGRQVRVHLGVNQADRVEVPRLVDEVFGKEPLDIVVDDASHLLEPTTATFEILFPRLRPGGIYIIEDWADDHLLEREFLREVAANPDGELARKLAAGPKKAFQMPTSFVVCQLLIAAARHPDWITVLRASDAMCEVRRGEAFIEPGTPLSSYSGIVGQRMFNQRVS